jgi:hypothetical protein
VSSVHGAGSRSWDDSSGVTMDEQYDEHSASESEVDGHEDAEEELAELDSMTEEMRRGGGGPSTSCMI